MVDKKTGVKPKKVVSSKKQAGQSSDARPQILEELEEPTLASSVERPTSSLAKAGKHSAKAIKEVEEKQAKQERKASKTDAKTAEAKKAAKKPPRTRLERAGKKYRELAKLIDQSKSYSLNEALELATKTNPAKFDATVELHINLGVDPTQADHNVRGMVSLPAGSGKDVRIAVFADGEDATKAKKAGAELAGVDELTVLLDKEQLDFDVLISTPLMMAKLGKYAKMLGPRGLMPNPKSGTVAADVAKAVTEAKAGRVEYRVDSAGIVHLGVGKVSFGPDKLTQNSEAIISAIRAAKPASLKGAYIESIYVTTSMGPSIKVNS